MVKNHLTDDEPDLSFKDRPCRYITSPRPEGSWSEDPPAFEFMAMDFEGDVGRVSLRYEAKSMHVTAKFRWLDSAWKEEEVDFRMH